MFGAVLDELFAKHSLTGGGSIGTSYSQNIPHGGSGWVEDRMKQVNESKYLVLKMTERQVQSCYSIIVIVISKDFQNYSIILNNSYNIK